MDLYGLPPEEFTAARDAAATQDKALKALRKPTVSAWVLNTLVRREPALLDDLTALGVSLTQAQQQGQGEELRALTEQRRQLVASVTQHAVGLVDRAVSAAARAEVEATLEAVLADAASAEAVRSGQLVRALSFAGFGGADVESAVAPLPRVPKAPATRPTVPQPASSRARDTSAAEARARSAAGALDDAVRTAQATARALVELDQAVARARAAEEAAEVATRAAREALADAELTRQTAHRARRAAEKERDPLARRASGAAQAVAAAQHVADSARQVLHALRRT